MVSALDTVFREQWGRVLASLIGFLGDYELAEDAAQEAFAIAAARWPADGVPDHPAAWLITAARNRAINRIRRQRTLQAKLPLLAAETTAVAEMSVGEDPAFPDERLELVFMCCHPALSREAQVALTLRSLGGLSTEEIARAFLVPEATMAQRLVRAKRKLRAAAVPFRIPGPSIVAERLSAVLAVIYLMFNEGYRGRAPLAADALRLGRALAELMPAEPEVHGLLALMLLNDSRRDARVRDEEIVLLGDQDRSQWDDAKIAAGRRALDHALALAGRGPYVIQAAIAALHVEPHTDWPQIALLYAELARLTGSPVVELNRAIAVAETDGPQAGLAILDTVALDEVHYLHAARADLLARLDRRTEAGEAYDTALALVRDPGERRLLERRRAALCVS